MSILAFDNLHMTINTNESSKAEFGSRGLEPSHFKIVPSSSGIGRKLSVDIDTLPFVCCVIYMKQTGISNQCEKNFLQIKYNSMKRAFINEHRNEMQTKCVGI